MSRVIGVWTLYKKEVWRFSKIYGQTLLSPCLTTLLFLAIFSLALGRSSLQISGLQYTTFLSPGLIMMAMMQNAFGNNSSSMIISKVQGNIVDVLMPPLSAWDKTFAYAISGMTRGVIVGIATTLSLSFFVEMSIHNLSVIITFALLSSLLLSLLGLIGGIWSKRFEEIGFITNFIITPLSFLSGTFYSLERLPDMWKSVALCNPFFYMIDGFRYGFTGYADISILQGVIILTAVNIILWLIAQSMFHRGYRLKD